MGIFSSNQHEIAVDHDTGFHCRSRLSDDRFELKQDVNRDLE